MKQINITGIFIALMITVPFALPLHSEPLTTFHVEWWALLLLTLGACALVVTHDRLVVPVYIWPILLFAVYAAAQALWLTYAQRAVLTALYALAGVVTIVMSLTVLHERKDALRYIVVPTVICALWVAFTGFVEYYHLNIFGLHIESSMQQGMSGALGQRNMFGVYMCIGLALLFCFDIPKPHYNRIVLILGAPLAIAAALSGSRLTWGLMLLAAIPAKDRRIWAALFGLFVIEWLIPESRGVTRPAGTGIVTEAFSSRWDLLLSGWRIWTDGHILFGAGIGEVAFQMYMHALPGTGPIGLDRHVHNIVMQILAETGLVGAGILGVAVVLWLESLDVYPRSAALAGTLMIVAYSFTEFPLWNAQYLLLFSVLVPFCSSSMRMHHLSWPRTGIVALALFIAAPLLTMSMVEYRKIEAFFRGETQALDNTPYFRPQVESFVVASKMLDNAPDTPLIRNVLARAMHSFPNKETACANMYLFIRSNEVDKAMAIDKQNRIVFGNNYKC